MRRHRHDPFLKRFYRAGTRDAITLFFPELACRIDGDQWEWIDKEVPILGRQEGEELALQRALKLAIVSRFPEAPAGITGRVDEIEDPAALKGLIRQVVLAWDLSEIEALLVR